VDWYALNSGEMASVAMGLMARFMLDPNPAIIRALFGLPRADAQTMADVGNFVRFYRKGDYAGASAALEKWPPQIAESRYILVLHAGLAGAAHQDAEERRLRGMIAAKYGDDPATAWSLISYYQQERQFDKALHAVEVVEKRVGVDGTTIQRKAQILYKSGQYVSAIALAQQALRLEPDNKGAYISLGMAYIGNEDYSLAVATFEKLSARFGDKFARAQFREARFAGFVRSDVFNQWLPR
jgi:tetratricopeptide (TPR) repeat protein